MKQIEQLLDSKTKVKQKMKQIERLLDSKTKVMQVQTHSWRNEHLCCTMKNKIFFDSYQTPTLQVTVEPSLCIRTSKFETYLIPHCGVYDLIYNFVTDKVQFFEKQRGCLRHPLATDVFFCLNRLDNIEIAEPNYWISASSLQLVKKENEKQVRLTAFSTFVPVSHCGTYQFCILSGWTSWSLTLKNQDCKWCKEATVKKDAEESKLELFQKIPRPTKSKQKKKRKEKKKSTIKK